MIGGVESRRFDVGEHSFELHDRIMVAVQCQEGDKDEWITQVTYTGTIMSWPELAHPQEPHEWNIMPDVPVPLGANYAGIHPVVHSTDPIWVERGPDDKQCFRNKITLAALENTIEKSTE